MTLLFSVVRRSLQRLEESPHGLKWSEPGTARADLQWPKVWHFKSQRGAEKTRLFKIQLREHEEAL